MGSKFDKFFLLMWKNFLIQWRHPMQTVVEILAPVLFSILLVIVRSLVDPEEHEAVLFAPFKNSLPLNKTYTSSVVWSPQNPYLEKLMKHMAKSIQDKNGVKIKPIRLNDSEALEQHMTNELNLLTTLAGLQFDDALNGDVKLPANLNIVFRFPAELRYSHELMNFTIPNWRTHQLFPLYQVPGPRDWLENEGASPNYYHEGFLMLQQELSFAIINHFKKELYGVPFDHKSTSVQMQRFPYPRWVQDDLLTALQTFVSLIIMLSFVYPCISTVKVITVEKEKNLKEVMKIMGLPNWLHWTTWFLKSFVFLAVAVALMVTLAKVSWYTSTDHTVFTHSDATVIFFFMILYMCATITFCFAVSVFFSKANTAATIAGTVWFVTYFPFMFLRRSYDSLNLTQKLSASLFFNTAMGYGFQLMLMFEGMEEGLQWYNLWKRRSPDDSLVLGQLMVMLVIDTLLYLGIALYVEQVYPGEHGVPKPWYFLFTRSHWCGTSHESDLRQESPDNEANTEQEPLLEIGIKVQNLHKKFLKKVAVENLSVNMHRNQITVLLGHNGAGKTTTMSMLTGLLTPSGGTAFIEGYDIRTQMNKIRENLGFCPQYNILFDELTVAEHLYFYCRLKGMPKADIPAEIEKYVEQLDLINKKNAQSVTLSGGMKRKLSIGVALCAGSKVVMCDEPTSGMDPSARRALWDLLKAEKNNRTILLTTHYMDEADLLGDRIAIMANGKLQCCGSSFFLKKKYGAGYHLIMDKSPWCNVDNVTEFLQKYIPNLTVETNVGSELTYLLSEQYSCNFEEMLNGFESHKDSLGIRSFGISLTTLEEVFMKVGADTCEESKENSTVITPLSQNDSNVIDTALTFPVAESSCLDGYTLWKNQLLAMLVKKIISVYRSWVLLLIQNAIPVFFVILAIILSRNRKTFDDLPNLKMSLSSYDNPVTVLTRNSSKFSNEYIQSLQKSNMAYIDWDKGNMTERMLLETANAVATVRQRYIIGATFNHKNITAWFNNEPHHSPALSLQTVLNSILHKEISPNYSIEISNHPLPYTMHTKMARLDQGSNVGFQLAFNIGFSMAFVTAFYVMFYIKERVSKAKHLQFVSGVSVIPFWLAAFICDFVTFTFTSSLIVITLAVFQEDGFDTAAQLSRIFTVFLFFGLAVIPLMYLASYCFDVPSTGYTRMTLVNIFTGVAMFLVVQILMQPELHLENAAKTLHWIFLLVPHYSFSCAFRDLYVIYSVDKLCNYVIQSCIDLHLPGLTPEICKEQVCKLEGQCCSMTRNFYDWHEPGIGRNVVFLTAVAAVLICILLLIEYRLFEIVIYKLKPEQTSAVQNAADSDVIQEAQKIRNCSREEVEAMPLVLRDVTKYYGNFLAVNNLCLGANKYECFGLLGVNGAGKTTTFKMLTGDIKLSSGEAFVNGLSLKSDIKKIHHLIGYCPQFDALFEDLTSREMLMIFGLLRGMHREDVKMVGEKLASELDFFKHIDKKTNELSGGNKRKLSMALALIGNPQVIYLDEPTTGVDAATKRYLWNALCKVRDRGKCIILTTHSMEECEALCTRLAIMVNGSFMCLGSTQHLKSKFSDGYTLTIKIKKFPGRTCSESLQPVINFVEEHFLDAVVREQHEELITFYIANKVLPWSKMFGIMEYAKKNLNIDDYYLGQCSLEQVFLSFVKHQREELC